jgi:hypothetical protein
MMVAPVLMLWLTRPAQAYKPPALACGCRRIATRLFSLTSVIVESNISRLSTLQTLLSSHGAPGSDDCHRPGDLEPIALTDPSDTPELVASMTSGGVNIGDAFADLHPYLFPISKSKTTSSLICAYRSPATEESDKSFPWPLVESRVGAPGMKLLALNSEHLMRRIVCELDHADSRKDLIELYNQNLGKGILRDKALDQPYELGSVAKMGYGVEKFVLLRVGPFPDLYQEMSRQHAARGDQQSSLIAAETANRKLSGFASSFRYYARLLSSFPNRREEARDAARMCLRLHLPTIGQSIDAFREVAVLGQLCEESDTDDQVFSRIKDMYTRMRQADAEDPKQSGKTETHRVLDDAEHLVNEALLDSKEWSTIRPELSQLFRSIGRVEMASFVDIQ